MTHRRLYRLPLLFFFFIFIASCEIINPDEDIPSYIHIDSVDLVINDPVQGSSSHKITDAWVYLDENLIGTYELPVTLPVLASGKHNIKIRAGIKLNGITASRVYYPFYTFYSEVVDLEIAKIDSLKPYVNYFPTTTFAWKEDFEDSGVKIERLSDSDTSITLVHDPSLVFEGNAVGAIFLDDNRTLFKGSSLATSLLKLPKGGAPVFLEMNYKNNQDFNIGIIATHPTYIAEINVILLKPTEDWNKIYINLTNHVSEEVGAVGFQLFLAAKKDSSISASAIYLDNLKIVY